MALLLISKPERAVVWKRLFETAGEPIVLGAEAVGDPSEITHIACWVPPADLQTYPNLRMIISVGAGTDHIGNLPDGVRLVRTLAPGIEAMVRDWVVMAALMLHREMPLYIKQAQTGIWDGLPSLPAGQRRVGIMGMGRIGQLAARTLSDLGFAVTGWSRSGNPVDGIEIYGSDALGSFLAQSDILVCLLPLTEETRKLLDADLFARLPRGARLVQAGRGAQLDMDAMLSALDSGQLYSAMLDVTDPEPLPPEHPAWRHPRVIITPHIGAHTDAEEGACHALNVLRADRNGLEIPGLVDLAKGY